MKWEEAKDKAEMLLARDDDTIAIQTVAVRVYMRGLIQAAEEEIAEWKKKAFGLIDELDDKDAELKLIRGALDEQEVLTKEITRLREDLKTAYQNMGFDEYCIGIMMQQKENSD